MYELMPIQMMHMMNVNGYTLRLVRQSGTVIDNMDATGKENAHHMMGNTPVGTFHMGETANIRLNIIFTIRIYTLLLIRQVYLTTFKNPQIMI